MSRDALLEIVSLPEAPKCPLHVSVPMKLWRYAIRGARALLERGSSIDEMPKSVDDKMAVRNSIFRCSVPGCCRVESPPERLRHGIGSKHNRVHHCPTCGKNPTDAPLARQRFSNYTCVACYKVRREDIQARQPRSDHARGVRKGTARLAHRHI